MPILALYCISSVNNLQRTELWNWLLPNSSWNSWANACLSTLQVNNARTSSSWDACTLDINTLPRKKLYNWSVEQVCIFYPSRELDQESINNWSCKREIRKWSFGKWSIDWLDCNCCLHYDENCIWMLRCFTQLSPAVYQTIGEFAQAFVQSAILVFLQTFEHAPHFWVKESFVPNNLYQKLVCVFSSSTPWVDRIEHVACHPGQLYTKPHTGCPRKKVQIRKKWFNASWDIVLKDTKRTKTKMQWDIPE